MESKGTKTEFSQQQWQEKAKSNNNFDDKENFCKDNDDSKLFHAQYNCIQQTPAVELPPDESAGDEAVGSSDLLLTNQVKATAVASFNDDEENIQHQVFGTLSPPNSNRTSVNNSTENLSYSSDNYYVDELIVLQNTLSDEEVSLNSDDCIYAYRGGAEFDTQLPWLESKNNNIDDETDFLEMDFDPDPSSEIDPTMELRSMQYPSVYLSSSIDRVPDSTKGCLGPNNRQLFSSPTHHRDTILNQRCPTNKDFAHLSLNLTQIQSKTIDGDEHQLSPITVSCAIDGAKSKVTGAKPKRITERSIGATKNRKAQIYAKMNKTYGSSSLCSAGSLDERGGPVGFPLLNSANTYTRRELSDETCLDCLEKEFLANTIGKPIEWSECPKCKKKRSFRVISSVHCNNSNGLRISSSNSSGVLCCRPPSLSLSFDLSDIFPSNQNKPVAEVMRNASGSGIAGDIEGCNRSVDGKKAEQIYNNQRALNDNFDANKRTDKSVQSTFSTFNLDEQILVQALDKLKIAYNKELIIEYFKANLPEFNNLKQYILYQSKKNCNHPKLKKLIELACNGAVTVEYHTNEQIEGTEMIQVQVTDILHQWARKNNLELLKQLDDRFFECNILGKIIYVIRQAHQRNNGKPFAEHISIPQYYKSGYISVGTKN